MVVNGFGALAVIFVVIARKREWKRIAAVQAKAEVTGLYGKSAPFASPTYL